MPRALRATGTTGQPRPTATAETLGEGEIRPKTSNFSEISRESEGKFRVLAPGGNSSVVLCESEVFGLICEQTTEDKATVSPQGQTSSVWTQTQVGD